MIRFPRTCSLGVIALIVPLLLLTGGCGGREAGTVTLTGRVTLDGKPVDGASVAFVGREGARLSTAQTNSAGEFTITAAEGRNAISVSKAAPSDGLPPAIDEDSLMPSDEEYARIQQQKPRETGIPAKYADPKTSGIAIEVVSGMSDVELALSST